MEKFQSKKEFSVFSLWNIKEVNQQSIIEKSLKFNQILNKAQDNESQCTFGGEECSGKKQKE